MENPRKLTSYDIDTIVLLFKERGNISAFQINNAEPDNLTQILNRFPVFEKYNCFSFSYNLKQGKDIKQLLEDNEYKEPLSIEDLNKVLKYEITPTSAFIVFFNIFSFLFCIGNEGTFYSKEFLESKMTIDSYILFMKCLTSLSQLSLPDNVQSEELFLRTKFYEREIFFFFKNIFVLSFHFYEENDQSSTETQITESFALTLRFFDSQKRLPVDFYDIFISFIFKPKVKKFAKEILNLLLKMFRERRPFIFQNDLSKIIDFANPFLRSFNESAIDLIIAVSTVKITNSVIECFSSLSEYLLNKIIESNLAFILEDENVDLPYNIDDKNLKENSSKFDFIKEISFEFIETKSEFKNGFILPKISNYGINWLLSKIDIEIIRISSKLNMALSSINEQIADKFFSSFKAGIQKINEKYYLDSLAIFFHLAELFKKSSFISNYFDVILNPHIFNEKESIFTSLSDVKNAFRDSAFNILSDYPETIAPFIINSLNPLFRTELFLRIKKPNRFFSIIRDVSDVCVSLRNLDIQFHCKTIEDARCSCFYFLAKLFLSMFNGYNHFDDVMQFCLEKNLTNIFLNIFKESSIASRNFELLPKVFGFVSKLFNASLDLSWKFIKIIHDIFERNCYLVPQMKKFFVLIMNYIWRLNSSKIDNYEKKSYKAVIMSLKYITLLDSVNAKYIHLISSSLSHNMSDKLYLFLLEKIGKSPKYSNKFDSFLIKHPIFVPIMLFSIGFTKSVMRMFNNLCTFSIRNCMCFHDQLIDSVLIQIIQKKKAIKYQNEIFNDFYYDPTILPQSIKELLFHISSVKTDYRIVSEFIKDINFVPFIYSLLANYQQNKLPILSIPTTRAESKTQLSLSHFQNNFSVTFWIYFDINYLLLFPTENVEFLTIQNGLNRFGFYMQGTKLRAYFANGTKRSDVNLNFFKSNKCIWTFIASNYNREKKSIQTFCYEMPMNKSEFEDVIFDETNPITISINPNYTKRNYNPKNNYYSFYSFSEKEFIGFIKDISFCSRKLEVDEILRLKNKTIESTSLNQFINLSVPGDFNIHYENYDNLYNVLRRESIINKLIDLLLKPKQEENICYNILNIIGILADSIKIPFASLMMFVLDRNHFEFKNTFNCFYFSIFKNIKTNQEIKSKFFDKFISNVSIWSYYINFSQILFFYQNKFIIDNSNLLKKKSGLALFLHYFELIEMRYWSDYIIFLKRIFEKTMDNDGKDEQTIILNYIYSKYEKIEKNNKNQINKIYNLSYVIFNQIKPEASNITAFYQSIDKSCFEIPNEDNTVSRSRKTPEIHSNKEASTPAKKEKKKTREDKISEAISKTKKIDLLDDIPDDFKGSELFQAPTSNPTRRATTKPHKVLSIPTHQQRTGSVDTSNKTRFQSTEPMFPQSPQKSITKLVQECKNENDSTEEKLDEKDRMYIIYMLELINFKPFLFTKDRSAFTIILHLLRLKDFKITKSVLICLYNISSGQSISTLTLIAFNNINAQFFYKLFDFLKDNLNKYPNFFPLLCALAYSIEPQPDCFKIFQKFNRIDKWMNSISDASYSNAVFNFSTPTNSLSNSIDKIDFDPWYFFPILLGFKINHDTLLYLFKILINNLDDDKLELDRMVFLFHFFSNYFDNNLVVSEFLENIYSFKNAYIFYSIKYFTMILFTHPYFSEYSSNNLLYLINNESFMSNSISFEVGIRLYRKDKIDESYKILLKLLNSISTNIDEESEQLIMMLNSIFMEGIHYSNFYYENCLTCEQLIKEYKINYKENFKEVFSNLHELFHNNKSLKKTKNLIENKINDTLEIITYNQNMKERRLSSQYDCLFRQMIYRNDIKRPKCIELPESNCILCKNRFNDNFGINYQQNGKKVKIITQNSQRSFDLSQDINYAFKRKDKGVFELFTKFGKKYRLQFEGKNKKKDIAHNSVNKKILNEIISKWVSSEITNFEFLMILNAFSDNIHQEKDIFPSPLYKKKSFPLDKWSLTSIKPEEKKSFVSKIRRLTLTNRNSQNQLKKLKNKTSLIKTEDGFDIISKNDCDYNDEEIEDVETPGKDNDILSYFVENPIIPARYFYDFEIYSQENKENKYEFLYKLRKAIENYSDVNLFAQEYLGIEIQEKKKPISLNQEIIQNNCKNIIVFCNALYSSSFIAFTSNLTIKCIGTKSIKSSNSFLPSTGLNNTKKSVVNENSLIAFISSYKNSSIAVNLTESFLISKYVAKSQLYQLDDGIASFDPIKRILLIFTNSSIETISTIPSPLLLTSSGSIYSNSDFNDFRPLVPIILSTPTSSVFCKTYTTPLSDSVNLMCGNSERQFYTVSPTVVYSNNCFFAQFNNSIKILKVSMMFNVLIAVTIDEKVHILSSTSGKKVATINMNDFDDDKFNEIAEIVITHNFGFLFVIMNDGKLFLFTLNGSLIKNDKLDTRYRSENIKFWFTFDTLDGIDYLGFVTNDNKVNYFEAFYPNMPVVIKSQTKFTNVIAVNYNKFAGCFFILNTNCEIYNISHKILTMPIEQTEIKSH